MTFQWTAVAVFLYAEIALIVLLCLPIISPVRWQKIFTIPVWNVIRTYWNKAFLTIIVLLIVLFLDAVREVRKYSNLHISDKTPHTTTSAFEHVQMKLFRSQRNLYISGFSLFLWFVLRRTISLISMLAEGMGDQQALEMQVENTSTIARKYLAENEKLQQSFDTDTKHGTKQSSDEENKKLKQEVEKLKTELKKTSNALTKATDEMSASKKRYESLRKEYDHLSKEHKKLQDRTDETPDKKNM